MNRYIVPVVGVSVLAAVGLFSYAKITGKPVQKPAAAAVSPTVTNSLGYMSVAPIEGKDVAQLLNLQAYKWKVGLPKKAKTMVLWAEDWRKGIARPKVHAIAGLGVDNPTPTTLLIKLPDSSTPTFVAIFGNSISSKPQTIIDETKGSRSINCAPNQKLLLEKDVILAAITQNRSGSFSFSEKPSELIKDDRTVLYKMRVTSHVSNVWPSWKNGQIVLS